MMNATSNIQVGTSRSLKNTSVVVMPNQETVGQVAMITSVVLRMKFPSLSVSEEEMTNFNEASLKAALMRAIDPDCKLDRRLVVPAYYDSVTEGLQCQIGRTVINSELPTIADLSVPDGYEKVKLQLMALGVKCLRPRRPVVSMTKTLLCDVALIDGVLTLIGNLESIGIDDMVRRSLIDLEEQSLEVMRGLLGELAFQYGEVDQLLTNHFSATVRVS